MSIAPCRNPTAPLPPALLAFVVGLFARSASAAPATTAVPAPTSVLGAGFEWACVAPGGGGPIRCFRVPGGRFDKSEEIVVRLAFEPTRIFDFYSQACASNGIRAACWNMDRSDPVVRSVEDLSGLAMGDGVAYVLRRGSVWLADDDEDMTRSLATDPILSDVDSVAGDGLHACAVSRGSVFCWTDSIDEEGRIEEPRPTYVAPGQHVALYFSGICVSEDSTVRCFSAHDSDRFLTAPSTIRHLSVGPGAVCVLTVDDTVLCSPLRGPHRPLEVVLKGASNFAAGASLACATTQTELVCWHTIGLRALLNGVPGSWLRRLPLAP